MNTVPTWRAASKGDLAAIDRIARQIHPALPERSEVFAEKLALFPEGCRVLMSRGTIVGHGLSHPWRLHSVPPLDTVLTALPAAPDCVFIHDVALLLEARGQDAARRFVEIIAAVARGRNITSLALVSVYGTQPLWARLGFEVVPGPTLASKLKSYGDGAAYMIRKLG